MAIWPSSLEIERNAFKEITPDRVVRSNMGFGPDKTRKRTSLNVRTLTFSMTLTDALLTAFDAFFLANDALWFTFTDPRTGVSVQARFKKPPEYQLDETLWKVAVELETLP